jgi:hypothetical protein
VILCGNEGIYDQAFKSTNNRNLVTMSNNTKFQQELKKVLPTTFQGSVKQVIKFIQEYSKDMTEEDKQIKEEYQKRFFEYDFPKTDDLPEYISELLTAFYKYWSKQMIGEESHEEGSNKLAQTLIQLALKYVDPNLEITGIESLRDPMTAKVEELGYYTLLAITSPYFECMLWKESTEQTFEVELPEGKTNVKIIFIDDFLCYGWMGFATFDKHKTGGWATKEVIYSVGSPTQDINDEKFTIPTLMHEGRHFLDYKMYPSLQQPELEFRAKLTELSCADKILYEKLEQFLAVRNETNRNTPHALGNYFVTQVLSRDLFEKELESDITKWKELDKVEINDAAKRILKANNSYLEKNNPKEIEIFLGTEKFLD